MWCESTWITDPWMTTSAHTDIRQLFLRALRRLHCFSQSEMTFHGEQEARFFYFSMKKTPSLIWYITMNISFDRSPSVMSIFVALIKNFRKIISPRVHSFRSEGFCWVGSDENGKSTHSYKVIKICRFLSSAQFNSLQTSSQKRKTFLCAFKSMK